MDCMKIGDMLSAYIDDCLEAAEREQVKQHLDSCPACRQELADLHKTVEIVKALGEVIPPEHFHDQLTVKLHETKNTTTTDSAQRSVLADKNENRWQTLFRMGSRHLKTQWAAVAAVLLIGSFIGALTDNTMTPFGRSPVGQIIDSKAVPQEEFASTAGSNKDTEGGVQYRYTPQSAADSNSPVQTMKAKTKSETSEQEVVRGYQREEAETSSQRKSVNPEVPEVKASNAEPQYNTMAAPTTENNKDQVKSLAAPPVNTMKNSAPPAAANSFAAAQNNTANQATTNQAPDQPTAADQPAAPENVNSNARRQDPAAMTDENSIAPDTADQSSAVTGEDTTTDLQTTEKEDGGAAAKDKTDLIKGSVSQKISDKDSPAPTEQQLQLLEIKNCWLTIEVPDFDETVERIGTLAAEYKGFVQETRVNGNSQKTGTFIVRVPKENFNDAISGFEKIGIVTEKRFDSEDSSAEYRDVNTRLNNLRRQEARLLALVDKAGSLKDVMDLENEINRVRQEIESLVTKANYLTSVSNLATLTLDISEADAQTNQANQGVFGRTWAAFTSSCQSLIHFIGWLVVGFGRALPFLAVLFSGVAAYKFYRSRTK